MSVFVGLMSGTSLDGISAAVVRFREGAHTPVDAELLAFIGSSYTAEQRDRLLRALTSATAQEYCRLSFDLGEWLAQAAIAVLAEAGVPRSEVVAIGSHGQTIWHEAPHSTWQLGEAAVIAERTGIDVVSDFRVRDVAAGGQGAPLVPIADAMLFAGDDWRALQNIGGIGNVTVLPPGGQIEGVRAFDTGPGVSVIDAVTRRFAPGAAYDVDGAIAALGLRANRIAVGGDSAGAALAAAVCQRAKLENGPSIALQLLLCPALDIGTESESRRAFAEGYFLDKATIDWTLKHYCPETLDPADPRLSPLHAADVSSQPPAHVHTAEFDPLVCEGRAYADRLEHAGVEVRYMCHAGMIHHFYGMADAIPYARVAIEAIGADIRKALAPAESTCGASVMTNPTD
jgi:hypothetical protein